MILTGTGELWQTGTPEVWNTKFMDWPNRRKLEMYHESLRMIENMVHCLDIPTIGAINGTGAHWQLGTLCDITICTEDTAVFDAHYLGGVPPGDGIVLALQRILGTKKAAYYAYTGMNITAEEALDLGLVSEVLPREQLLPRAWELAELIMQAPALQGILRIRLWRTRGNKLWQRIKVFSLLTNWLTWRLMKRGFMNG